jgi:hypothetical protein
MDMELIGKKLAAVVEVELEKLVEAKSDAVVTALLEQLKKAIPGGLDDVAIEAAKPSLLPIVKMELLKQVEKISAEV